MWYMHEGMGWWMVLGGMWTILLLGGLIALIIWGINWFTRRDATNRKEHPLEIAKERYARGEISREEYEQIKKEL